MSGGRKGQRRRNPTRRRCRLDPNYKPGGGRPGAHQRGLSPKPLGLEHRVERYQSADQGFDVRVVAQSKSLTMTRA